MYECHPQKLLQNEPVADAPCETSGPVSTSVSELAAYGTRPALIRQVTTAPTAVSVRALPDQHASPSSTRGEGPPNRSAGVIEPPALVGYELWTLYHADSPSPLPRSSRMARVVGWTLGVE